MNLPRFSVFEAIVFAFKTVIDNIRLFFFAGLAKLGFFFSLFLVFSLFSINIIKKLWVQWPSFVALFKSPSIEVFKSSAQQLWTNISGPLSQYIVIFSIFAIIAFVLGIGDATVA